MNSIFIIHLFSLFKYFNSYLLFPIFSKENPELNYIENLINSSIYTNISIGTPIQTIPMNIKLDDKYFYISGNEISIHNYEENKSLSLNKKESQRNFYDGNLKSGIISNDTFYFVSNKEKNIKKEKFGFILSTNLLNMTKPNVLGLKINPTSYYDDGNFMYYLKYNNLIEYYIFTMTFLDFNKGELLIGEYPHDYNSKDYNENNFVTSRTGRNNFYPIWEISISNIFINEEILDENNYGTLDIESVCLVGNNIYQNKIYDLFFKQLINNNMCFEKYSKFSDEFYYYFCKENVNIKNFPNLNFYNKEMNIFFNFTYEDLFVLKDNNLYFLIVFKKNGLKGWNLGRLFMKKYSFLYDTNRKLIGYYKPIKNTYSIIFTFIIIILGIIIIMLVIYLIYILKNKKKKLFARELTEEIIEEHFTNK